MFISLCAPLWLFYLQLEATSILTHGAYALTVHKAQGSDFETVYLIIPQSANTLTRELIYTGLTRFRKNLVLLVQNDIQPLLRLRQAGNSCLLYTSDAADES